ncbi:hypothetical protein BT96DRAFT_947088 [Gymnopus androsaceus JB14]|uniref:Uncharacterized protein n=1 Tax=Gymnopus androsaceus JB14 TaxID=1447944 RepID=A0A6A4GUM0_9AGAR|nr:hypothetical protein BT96DRAFT_947088 [Gymnopus androsaceus JB14]
MELHAQFEATANMIFDVTADTTPEQFFDSPFKVGVIDNAKIEIGNHGASSTAGIEQVHYKDIVDMDSVLITKLSIGFVYNQLQVANVVYFNWIITIHAPNGITVFSLSLGFNQRVNPDIRELVRHCQTCWVSTWADACNIILKLQNGFQKGYRTNNNAFILQSAIEKARVMDPSTLWCKLQKLVASGKLCNWIRLIYRLMRYKVGHEGELSDFIDSSIGILICNILSPEFWIIFFSDFNIPVTDDDVRLAGMAISHLEQADDLLLLALSPKGL